MSKTNDEKKPLPELPHVIELEHPLPVKKNGREAEPLATVTIKRRPTYGDVERLAGLGRLAQGKRMVAAVTDCPEEAFGKLDLADARRVLKAVTPFFADDEDEEDGKTSSDDGDESE